ncbi:MAG: hypothetical protein IJR38_01055 [Selenomonadaceae bacterium]|nr:hypothetical protein [Selenomonadaceae bacterium]
MTFKTMSVGSFFLAAIVAGSIASCDAGSIDSYGAAISDRSSVAGQTDLQAVRRYEHNGLRLSIPREYDKLLVVDMPKDSGMLFRVSEKASILADKAQGGSGEGAGWLFGIGTITATQLYDMLQHDMSGAEIFAKDDAGVYYVYYHPTDVRLVREKYEQADTVKDWTMLNAWAHDTVRERFIADNKGLAAEAYGNSDLDIYLARAAFDDVIQYTLGTSVTRPWHPMDISPAPYAMRLMRNAQTEPLYSATAPEGDYVVLNFPKDGIRFDFFLAEGSENIYRQIGNNGRKQLFRIKFADGRTKAAEVVKEWSDALAIANDRRALGYTADSLIGRWAEKIVGRGLVTVTQGAKDTYDVRIEWANGAAEQHIWEMKARPNGERGVLHYAHGCHRIRTYQNEKDFSEKTVYENGTGKFYLNSVGELMWQDNVDGAGDNTVFVNCGD